MSKIIYAQNTEDKFRYSDIGCVRDMACVYAIFYPLSITLWCPTERMCPPTNSLSSNAFLHSQQLVYSVPFSICYRFWRTGDVQRRYQTYEMGQRADSYNMCPFFPWPVHMSG